MASVLETFYFLFESDAKKTKKEFDEVSKSTDSMGKNLKSAGKDTQKLDNDFSTLVKTAGGVVAAFLSIQTARKAMELSSEINDLGNFTKMLGISTEKTFAWGQAITRFGGDANTFKATLSSLNSQLVETSLTGTSGLVPAFNMLGLRAIDAGGKARSAFEVLPEIAQSFEKLSKMESAALGQKMGLDPATILMLQKGRKEVETIIKRQSELGVVNKKQVDTAEKLKFALTDMNQVFGSFARELLTAVSPAIISLTNTLTDIMVWVRENKAFVIGFFTALAGAILFVLLPAIGSLIAASATLALIWAPVIIPLAAVALAIGLIADEIYNFIQGNDTLIGKILPSWTRMKELIDEAIKAVKDFFAAASVKVPDFLLKGKTMIEDAASYVGNSMTSSSISNQKDGDKSFNFGNISIVTAATDAKGIAESIGTDLMEQMRTAVATFDNGVKI